MLISTLKYRLLPTETNTRSFDLHACNLCSRYDGCCLFHFNQLNYRWINGLITVLVTSAAFQSYNTILGRLQMARFFHLNHSYLILNAMTLNMVSFVLFCFVSEKFNIYTWRWYIDRCLSHILLLIFSPVNSSDLWELDREWVAEKCERWNFILHIERLKLTFYINSYYSHYGITSVVELFCAVHLFAFLSDC